MSLNKLKGHDAETSQLFEALNLRLYLRYIIIGAIEISTSRSDAGMVKAAWREAWMILDRLKQSHSLGKPVPEAFSSRLQRSLASTMPPRPIVQLPFDEAFGHLQRLIGDAIEVVDVLNYTDSICLQVREPTISDSKLLG
jgi:N-alpha-acetyltransferase 35, NatC auxiliary subunit